MADIPACVWWLIGRRGTKDVFEIKYENIYTVIQMYFPFRFSV